MYTNDVINIKLLIYSLSSPDFLPIIHLLAPLRMATLKVPGGETAPRPNYPEYPLDIQRISNGYLVKQLQT